MKKIYTFLFNVIGKFLVFTTFLFTYNHAYTQEPLDPNGSFEEATTGGNTADPWFFGASSGQAEFTIVDTVAYTGNKSLFINVIQKYTGNFWDIQAVYEHIAVTPGMYQRATFFARSTSGFSLRAAIGTYDNYRELTSATFIINNDWTRVSLVSYNADQSELRVTISAFETGQYFIDDISLIESPIAGSTVVPTGDSIIIQTITSIDNSSNFDASSFTVKADGNVIPIQKVVLTQQNNKFALVLGQKILPNQMVEVSHTGGKILYSNPGSLPDDNLVAFTDEAYNLSQATGNTVENINSKIIKVYPNPASNLILIQHSVPIRLVNIYATTGQLIYQLKNASSTLDVSHLAAGIYSITFIDANNNVFRSKFIKK